MMRNILDLAGYDSIAAKQGFYILCRVREHILLTEPFDSGWGAANDAVRMIWARDFRVEHTHAEERVAA